MAAALPFNAMNHGQAADTIDDAVYDTWSDWTHQEVMLNAWGNRYTDIGGGVAASGDDRYVFVLNVCMVIGQPASGEVPGSAGSPSNAPAESQAKADPGQFIYAVTLATPQADGTLKHKVMYGQTLISIAEAYGITVNELRANNDMEADDTVIWPDQELLIRAVQAQPNRCLPRHLEADMVAASTETAVAPTPTSQPALIETAMPTQQTTQPVVAGYEAESKDGIIAFGSIRLGSRCTSVHIPRQEIAIFNPTAKSIYW